MTSLSFFHHSLFLLGLFYVVLHVHVQASEQGPEFTPAPPAPPAPPSAIKSTSIVSQTLSSPAEAAFDFLQGWALEDVSFDTNFERVHSLISSSWEHCEYECTKQEGCGAWVWKRRTLCELLAVPSKEIALNDTWPVADLAFQAAVNDPATLTYEEGTVIGKYDAVNRTEQCQRDGFIFDSSTVEETHDLPKVTSSRSCQSQCMYRAFYRVDSCRGWTWSRSTHVCKLFVFLTRPVYVRSKGFISGTSRSTNCATRRCPDSISGSFDADLPADRNKLFKVSCELTPASRLNISCERGHTNYSVKVFSDFELLHEIAAGTSSSACGELSSISYDQKEVFLRLSGEDGGDFAVELKRYLHSPSQSERQARALNAQCSWRKSDNFRHADGSTGVLSDVFRATSEEDCVTRCCTSQDCSGATFDTRKVCFLWASIPDLQPSLGARFSERAINQV